MREAFRSVEEIFRLHGLGECAMPPKVYLNFKRGDLRCMPAYAEALGFASVKNVNVHPGNRDIPTVMATLTLFDPDTGFPLAIMDATYLTAMRTGAAGGVAAKHLAREDARVAAFVGAGAQAHTQLEALLLARPGVAEIRVADLNAESAAALARQGERLGISVCHLASSAREAVRGADVVVTTTPSRGPVVSADDVAPGAHINAIGADAKGKQELDPALLKRARLVVDSWEQAAHSGEINVPLSQGLIDREDIDAELGEIVAGAKPGRETAEQITVFDSTGLAVQDLACACHVYEAILKDPKLLDQVRQIDLLSLGERPSSRE
jgi:alanine dehydrogenase